VNRVLLQNIGRVGVAAEPPPDGEVEAGTRHPGEPVCKKEKKKRGKGGRHFIRERSQNIGEGGARERSTKRKKYEAHTESIISSIDLLTG
jgi:hypothetical protein